MSERAEVIELSAALAARASGSSQADSESFRTILNALPAAVYITDANGWLTYFNPACVSLLGRAPELRIDRWSPVLRQFSAAGETTNRAQKTALVAGPDAIIETSLNG